MSYRNTASFGKRQEFIAIAELLKRGMDVYLTLVDDQGIDCIIRKDKGINPEYLDIQIKARSKSCKPRYAATFPGIEIRHPRKNYYFIFHSEQLESYWIMSSKDVVEHANRIKSGPNKGKYRLQFHYFSLAKKIPVKRPKFDIFLNNFGSFQ